ncbi:serine hydrolase domain-containing protein [Streptomyces sp. NPDC051976]|uniref:serine hydrolase domain-containing protein n=1 Tax=Streptomyces sp. NPDC051976 TaxID=3154947 RepID=UPI0034183F13
MTRINGLADEGFGAVADAFSANFKAGHEIGAACAVYRHGRKVVDLYAGVADRRSGRLWSDDTIVPVFSVSKGLVALCAYLIHQQGRLDFDAPVVRYWPEFGQAGKEDITVRELFSHRAGLIAPDEDISLDALAGWNPMVHVLAEQAPLWEPGTAYAYHPLTFGWLTGEVLRRITGHTPGGLLASLIAHPLSADAWIGLPREQRGRVAYLEPTPGFPEDPLTSPGSHISDHDLRRSLTLGSVFPIGFIDGDRGFNSPAVHAMEIPAANAIVSAAGLARIFAAAVTEIDGVRLLTEDSVADALTPRSDADDWYGGASAPDARFSTGFMLDGSRQRPLLSGASFGHDGAGGELAFADADGGLGFAYVNNQMGGGPADGRANRLTAALRECLG